MISPITGFSKAPLKVMVIVPSGFCFGLQNLTLDLFSHLNGRVDAHFLITGWNDGEFPRRVVALGYSQTVTWLGMFSRKLDWYNLKMTLVALWNLPIAWRDFIIQMWRLRPDVIYLANHHEVILLWPLLIFYRERVIVHMHDPSPPIPFQRISFSVWRHAVKKFLFISRNVQDRTALLGPLHPHDEVIHNGVHVSPLQVPRQRNDQHVEFFQWPVDSLVIGISGQMTETKGHEDFIAAAALIASSFPHARFVIGGKPIEPYCSRLKEQVLKTGLSDRFGWTGWLPSAQEFYNGINILVLASRHDEGFGLVVAEAMERGCVVVSTRSGGAVEIIEDGSCGLLVPKRDPKALAAALSRLAKDPIFLENLASTGRKRVVEKFNGRLQADRFLEAINPYK
jgi:glycosyltransferase involved in cell wall biosynthesis